jgi:predicted nucleic acid-binding protein
VILLDTSVLVGSLCGEKRWAPAMRRLLETGEQIVVPSLVLYEWLRGPRQPQELAMQQALFPREDAVPFDHVEAAFSAKLYRVLPRARGREMDIAIAACAISREAQLWTLNPADFRDIPGLRLAVLPWPGVTSDE